MNSLALPCLMMYCTQLGFALQYGSQESKGDPKCVFFTLNTYQGTFISNIFIRLQELKNQKCDRCFKDKQTWWEIQINSTINLLSFSLFRHNDLPWNIRKFIHNKLNTVNFTSNLKTEDPWGTSSWSHTDIGRLVQGQVGGQVSTYQNCRVLRHLNTRSVSL